MMTLRPLGNNPRLRYESSVIHIINSSTNANVPSHPMKLSKEEIAARQREVVFAPYGAARTSVVRILATGILMSLTKYISWKALVSYLSSGTISFRPIRSLSDNDYYKLLREARNDPPSVEQDNSDVSCSPKSMYALATKVRR